MSGVGRIRIRVTERPVTKIRTSLPGRCLTDRPLIQKSAITGLYYCSIYYRQILRREMVNQTFAVKISIEIARRVLSKISGINLISYKTAGWDASHISPVLRGFSFCSVVLWHRCGTDTFCRAPFAIAKAPPPCRQATCRCERQLHLGASQWRERRCAREWPPTRARGARDTL